MRVSAFWELMEGEFGSSYARSLAGRHVLGALGGQTAMEALAAGVEPRRVWVALCDDMDVPASRRLGADRPPAKPDTGRAAAAD
jgi:hypothetical protein